MAPKRSPCDAAGVDVPVFLAQDCGHVVDVDGGRTPTVVIDASSSPAVADLARVHAVEGIGDIRTEAVRSDDVLLLGIRLSVPVQATFVIAFELDRHAGFLADVVQEQSLAIAHTDPTRAAVDQPHWLAVDIDGPALARCLAPT